MYEGLYNVRKGLSKDDAKAVGLMTATLLVHWDEWLHRRVEEISFDQEDAATRDITLDFTLPYWFHECRETPPNESKRQLVPLTFLKKQSLINFRLRDGCDHALPLLTSSQNAQVGEVALIALAKEVLRLPALPLVICREIHDLVCLTSTTEHGSSEQLFHREDLYFFLRSQLEIDHSFRALARAFDRNFLACTMIEIGRHDRKVIHLSYEQLLVQAEEAGWRSRAVSLARGRARDVVIMAPRGCLAESSHLEIVAPDLLQIVDRRQVFRDQSGEPDQKKQPPGGHKRGHFHLRGRDQEGILTVTLIPESMTYMRLSTLVAPLGFLAIAVVWWAAPELRNGRGSIEAAAAVLLSFTAVIGLLAATRDGRTNMVRELLWPVQLFSLSPVLWTFLAGLAIVSPMGACTTRIWLAILGVLDFYCIMQMHMTARHLTTPVRTEAALQEG